MRFLPTDLAGAFVIESDPIPDERGHFVRRWCARELAEHGLVATLAQASASYNRVKGTLRGMHYQRAPHAETKLVACTRGAIYDVLVDLRPGPTYGKWIGYELTPQNGRMMYAPHGVAHGFLTLADDTEVSYFISEFHHAESARGVRHDDPAFGIAWPGPIVVISERDRSYPDYTPETAT